MAVTVYVMLLLWALPTTDATAMPDVGTPTTPDTILRKTAWNAGVWAVASGSPVMPYNTQETQVTQHTG